jgi:hypothetical protein
VKQITLAAAKPRGGSGIFVLCNTRAKAKTTGNPRLCERPRKSLAAACIRLIPMHNRGAFHIGLVKV